MTRKEWLSMMHLAGYEVERRDPMSFEEIVAEYLNRHLAELGVSGKVIGRLASAGMDHHSGQIVLTIEVEIRINPMVEPLEE